MWTQSSALREDFVLPGKPLFRAVGQRDRPDHSTCQRVPRAPPAGGGGGRAACAVGSRRLPQGPSTGERPRLLPGTAPSLCSFGQDPQVACWPHSYPQVGLRSLPSSSLMRGVLGVLGR